MIKTLRLKNFTVFKEADLQFSPGLNVIIGENGTGKTHLLKIGYLFSNTRHGLFRDNVALISAQKVEQYFSERVRSIFKAEKIGNLTSANSDGKSSFSASLAGCVPTVKFSGPCEPEIPNMPEETILTFTFSNRSVENVILQDSSITHNAIYGKAVFLPSKEIVSWFEGFIALYDKREISFDQTYTDLAMHLAISKLKVTPPLLKQAMSDLAEDVGGTLELDGGKFYLVSKGAKRREITLVAEGVRKLATLVHLMENGSLVKDDTLFWDEPESNLNPKLIKDVAKTLVILSKNGIQVVIGTHSLFLLREIEILTSQQQFKDVDQRYFALGKSGDGVTVQQGNTIDDINPFVMLDEELAQSDRFINVGNL